jgi:outer membrane protein
MKRLRAVFVLAAFLVSVPASAEGPDPSSPITLKELYFSALKNSETIAVSDEAVRRAEALFRKALGDSLPEIFYSRSASFEENAKTGHDGFFEVTKSGFTGWGELAAIRSSGSTMHQRRFERRRAEQILLQGIAAAYYGLLLAQENVTASKKLVELARGRSEELDRRVQLGKTRKADALGQQVLIGSFESQLEESARQVGARRDLLAFLVASPLGERPVAEPELLMDSASTESYLATASTRPDVEAARENVRSFQGLMEVTRSEFFPSFGVSAAAYTDKAILDDEDVDWDVSVSMSVPVWDWGSRGSAMDAAGADLAESEKELSEITRQAELDIRNAYRDLESVKKQLEIRRRSLEAAREDFQLQAEDDSRGLVTSLEVLESLDRLNSAELAFNSARLQEKLAAINLKIAAGSDPKDILR